AEAAARWYMEVFGFEVAEQMRGAVFLRAAGTENHHDLGLIAIGPTAPRPERGRVGLYHLAWQVGSIHDLVDARRGLIERGAYVGESDHGVSKSLYALDPDGNEFEIMWEVPRDDWAHGHDAPIGPLDLDREVARYG